MDIVKQFIVLLNIAHFKEESLPALTHLFIVPADISLRSALAHSDDRKAIILFSASAGFLLANAKASGDLHPSFSKNQLAFFHTGRVLLDF
jgi:hypothetical protein